jgi:hypothetical protein
MTTDKNLIGMSATLAIQAVSSIVGWDESSDSLFFTVNVLDPCLSTVI